MILGDENAHAVYQDLELTTEGSDTLAATGGGSEEMESAGGKWATLASCIEGRRGHLLGLTFVVGLLLGWMVLGWLIWPVKWGESDPWDLRPEHQRRFVELVAEDYWQTRDVSYAKAALAGWDRKALAELLTQMEAEASDFDKRYQLMKLREALGLQEDLIPSILSEKVILLTTIMGMIPLLMAIILIAFPLVKRVSLKGVPKERPSQEATEQPEEILDQGEATPPAVLSPTGEGEKEPEKQAEKPGEQQKESQRGDETEKGREEEGSEELIIEEETDEQEEAVLDILADLFEEDNEELNRLEALSKSLDDIDINDLSQKSRETAEQLALLIRNERSSK